MSDLSGVTVRVSTGETTVDSGGSPVGVVRMDPNLSYTAISDLLRAYIDEGSPQAWKQILAKIDYTCDCLDLALGPLDAETGFGSIVSEKVEEGLRLLFKPNLVLPSNIDPQTHGAGSGAVTCTEWAFIAALMRWFHDRLDISYHRMAIGEAASFMSATAGHYTMLNPSGRRITTEAVMEGRSDDFYGGWGFYFARKYLAERLAPGRTDDPMRGYDESVAGTYIPPGLASDKLMVYDLNRVFDDASKGRAVEVPDGVNYQTIALHKVVVGGDPGNPEDRKAYPGCVLVNVPKLKVHPITLLTSAVKNLGIGLYPMESAAGEQLKWQYAWPHSRVPGAKAGIPHEVWVPEVDQETGQPLRDATGLPIVRKTGGISATMADVIKAVVNQGTFMIHVVDAIEAINVANGGDGVRCQEGLAVAGLDPVAVDSLCARYLFCNVPMDEAARAPLSDGSDAHFVLRVPVPSLESGQIVTHIGYDRPLNRERSLGHAASRGLGQREYHVVGTDEVEKRPLASVRGRLGAVADRTFAELTTDTLYFAVGTMPWTLQEPVVRYLQAVDQLAGTRLRQWFFETFDDDGDGVVAFEEFGRKGFWGLPLAFLGFQGTLLAHEPFGYLSGPFTGTALRLRWSDPAWNPDGLDTCQDWLRAGSCFVAYRMAQAVAEAPDPFAPGLSWGNGKWPSFQLASHVQLGASIYGSAYPRTVGVGGLYGLAFRYADAAQNEGRYCGEIISRPEPEAVSRYFTEMASGQAKQLAFTLYVPPGFGGLAGSKVPNVEETMDAFRLFTASFGDGAEIWPPVRPGTPRLTGVAR